MTSTTPGIFFGTDGIRARVGSEPFTTSSLERLGQAIGAWMCERYGNNAALLLAHDTRASCSFVKAALKSGLLRFPIRIFDGGILPTAAVVQQLRYEDLFDSGLIISASHNPYYDNGIKIVDKCWGKITEIDEKRINYFYKNPLFSSYELLGSDIPDSNAYERYLYKIQSFFKKDFLHGKKIVLDCAHGAAYTIAPRIFENLGATVIVLHNEPNGININKDCGALYPELLQRAVVHSKADIGFSFDGDADRVIAVNAAGEIKNGDDLLALLLCHPRYCKEQAVVGTIMSNQALEHYLNHHNKQLLRSQVGDKYVVQMMINNDLQLGGEPSGHLIARDYLSTGDGIFIALLVCETMHYLNAWHMNTFSKFPQVIVNVIVQKRKSLSEPAIEQVITTSQRLLNNGRLIVRYSGTELLLRIMVEDDSYEHALAVGTKLSLQLKEILT